MLAMIYSIEGESPYWLPSAQIVVPTLCGIAIGIIGGLATHSPSPAQVRERIVTSANQCTQHLCERVKLTLDKAKEHFS